MVDSMYVHKSLILLVISYFMWEKKVCQNLLRVSFDCRKNVKIENQVRLLFSKFSVFRSEWQKTTILQNWFQIVFSKVNQTHQNPNALEITSNSIEKATFFMKILSHFIWSIIVRKCKSLKLLQAYNLMNQIVENWHFELPIT